MQSSIFPLLAILAPLAGIPGMMSSKNANVREAWTFASAFATFALALVLLPGVLDGTEYTLTIAPVIPAVPLALKVDSLGMLFAMVSTPLWIVTSLYSIGYMRGLHEPNQTRYFCCFALAISATVGVAFSANLFTMYLFYEMLSFATYPLVTHHQDPEARVSGRKYLLYIVGGSIGLALPAMIIVFSMAGTLDFLPQGVLVGTNIGAGLMAVLVVMFIFGFAKAGVMPFHSWLPAAMVAPTPVSALLHAVAVVKVGVFSVVRVLTGILGVDLLAHFHMSTLISGIAAVTILTASLIALSQKELKRRLAFSTIGQLSYIILGVGLLTPKGITGGMVHIAMHAFGKITLFFCAGAIFVGAGKKYIPDMVGIGRRMPVTMTAFFIGSLSVIGIPLTGGFFSKWYMLQGALDSGQWIFMVVLLVSSLLNAAYFLPIVYKAFFCTDEESLFEPVVKEAPIHCLVPLCITAIVSVVLFFFPDVFRTLAELAVEG